MKQFLIPNQHKNEVLEWFRNRNLIHRIHFTWFPFFLIDRIGPALRLDIFNDSDAVAFSLCFGDIIHDAN